MDIQGIILFAPTAYIYAKQSSKVKKNLNPKKRESPIHAGLVNSILYKHFTCYFQISESYAKNFLYIRKSVFFLIRLCRMAIFLK